MSGRDPIAPRTREVRWERDRALVARCLDGDESAWEILIRRYRRLVYSVPIGHRLSPDQADEVFQRVAVKLLENLARLRRVEGLASWLVTTARRESLEVTRAESRRRSIESRTAETGPVAPPEVEADLERLESEHAVALAFEALDAPCRQLLEATLLEEPRPSYDEISRRLGRPIGSLGPTRARCLGKLRRLYRELGGEASWVTRDD